VGIVPGSGDQLLPAVEISSAMARARSEALMRIGRILA
jgi:hypothetical protein